MTEVSSLSVSPLQKAERKYHSNEVIFVGKGNPAPSKYIIIPKSLENNVVKFTDEHLIRRIEANNEDQAPFLPTKPGVLISVTGGAQDFYMHSSKIEKVFNRGMLKAAQNISAWIVDGGFDAGVVQYVGKAIKEMAVKDVPCIGIASHKKVIMNELLTQKGFDTTPAEYEANEPNSPNKCALNPNHTHFILVDSPVAQWGQEIVFRSEWEDYIRYKFQIPVVLIAVNGGPGTLNTVAQGVEKNFAIVVVQGSGRASDAVATLVKKAQIAKANFVPTCQSLLAIHGDGVDIAPWNNLLEEARGDQQKIHQWTDYMDRILANHKAITLFNADDETSADMDIFILRAILSYPGIKLGLEEKFKLGVVWNRDDIFVEVLDSEKDNDLSREEQRQALNAAFELAIQLDRPRIFNILAENGAQIDSVNLQRLYYYKLVKPYFKRLPAYVQTRRLPVSEKKTRLFRKARLYRFHPLSIHSAEAEDREYSKDNMRNRAFLKEVFRQAGHGFQGYYTTFERNFESHNGITSHKNHIVLNEHGAKTKVNFTDILIWAIFVNRMELAKVVWQHTTLPVHSALLSCQLYRYLANHCSEKEAYLENANWFEDQVIKMMDTVAYSNIKDVGLNKLLEDAVRAAQAPRQQIQPEKLNALIRDAIKHGDDVKFITLIDKLSESAINTRNAKGNTLLDKAVRRGNVGIIQALAISGGEKGQAKFSTGLDYYGTCEHRPLELAQDVRNQRRAKVCNLSGEGLVCVTGHLLKMVQNHEEINLSHNQIDFFKYPGFIANFKTRTISLAHNKFTSFPPLVRALGLRSIDISHNQITQLPDNIPSTLPYLETLDVSHNLLEALPGDLVTLRNLKAVGNPLSSLLPAYRISDEKIQYYLQMSHREPMMPWNQIKLMLVGQEGVGKTTLSNCLQDNKYKCNTNISTNGINISKLFLARPSSGSLFFKLIGANEKDQAVQFNVWDFGGQSVFHSTHRFFITSNALYIVLYDMSKPETMERVKYWIEQIGAINDWEYSKPILIVGTHADQLTKQERASVSAQMQQMYPVAAGNKNRNQIHGHFTLSITAGDKGGLADLQAKMLDLALMHCKIGIRHVQVPRSFAMLQKELEDHKTTTPYMKWHKYVALAESIGVKEDTIQDITTMLHDTGFVVWHNMPKLRDMVITNPQWLADAMAGVVSFMCQLSVSQHGGMTNWHKMRESLNLKFLSPDTHKTILALLEFFEIIYKMRINGNVSPVSNDLHEEQMFFVPSLLSNYTGSSHPSVRYWQKLEGRDFVRRFSWPFLPSGLFPRLLLRLVHLRLRPLASWLDAAVVMSRSGTECAFLQLTRKDALFCLEVNVKSDVVENNPLIAELSYVIARLHKDMFTASRIEVSLVHEVIHKQSVVPYEDCIKAQIEGKAFIELAGMPERIEGLVPDLSALSVMETDSFTIEKKLGEGGFGVVYKARSQQKHNVTVALKELQLQEDKNAIYEFQHEISIMSALQHENLVRLYGITISPLRMVLEFIPESDLHSLLMAKTKLTAKWKLKVVIDCAAGMKYLHAQCPPICHSDLRAPNIFIATLDENADVIGKIADFGLSQQVFPFSQEILHNLTETAPETWGGSGFYDEKSDIYSFAVIMWRLFGSKCHYTDIGDVDFNEYAFLAPNGKSLPPPAQREIFRRGGRPDVYHECPEELAKLIHECWKTLPEDRPPFSSILSTLVQFYETTYGEDEYSQQKKKEGSPLAEISGEQHRDTLYLQEFNKSSFSANTWKAVTFQEETTITSILAMGTEIWIGTSAGSLFVNDAKTRQIIQQTTLQATSTFATGSQTRGIKLISISSQFVWAAIGNEIHFFSSKISLCFLAYPSKFLFSFRYAK